MTLQLSIDMTFSPYHSCRIAHYDNARWYILGHHSAGSYCRTRTDPDAGQKNRAGAYYGIVFNYDRQDFERSVAAFWMAVIGKGRVWADKYVVTHAAAIPQLHAVLDSDAIADHDVILDKAVCAYIAIIAYGCTR